MRFLIFALLALLPLSAVALQKPAPRTCRVLFLARPADAPKSLFLYDGTTIQEVELGSMSFSPVYEVAAASTAVALLSEPPAAATGSAAPGMPAGAPKAALRESVRDFYLIVSSDLENKVAPVRLQVINANSDNFKTGQMMWYNLTDTLVGGIVGSQKLRLKPNSREILDAPASGDADYHVNIHFVPVGRQHTEPLCETRWLHDPRSRSVFFVLTEPGRIAPRIIGIPDFREKPDRDS